MAGTNLKQDVFFYGSFMDPKILRRHGAHPTNVRTARLHDWAIQFTALATIFRKRGSAVWGVLAKATPQELERIYSEELYPQVGPGHRYFPEAIVVSTRTGRKLSALVYVS